MVFSQQLPQEPWIAENCSRPLTEFLQFLNTEAAQDLRDEVDQDIRACAVRPK